MKVFYRRSYGCFVCTDRYFRPWWWKWRHHLPTRFTRGHVFLSGLSAFALAFVLSTFL